VLDLIESYQETREVWVEYGLQSIHDSTLRRVNRGHDYAAFLDALERTKRRGLKICVHVILGMPGESRDDMMATARAVAAMGIDSLKIHLMHILKDTPLEKDLAEGKFKPMEFDEYIGTQDDRRHRGRVRPPQLPPGLKAEVGAQPRPPPTIYQPRITRIHSPFD